MEDEGKMYRVWWDDAAGIARSEWQKGSVCTIDEARSLDAAVVALGHGAVPILVDLHNLSSIDRAAREFLNESDAYTATAFLVSSPATRMMANFFLGLQRGKSPNKMFTKEADALGWLQSAR
jgi:hypothetical protein